MILTNGMLSLAKHFQLFFCDKNRYNNGYVFRIETRSVFRDFPANKPDSDPEKLPTN